MNENVWELVDEFYEKDLDEYYECDCVDVKL